MGTASLLGPPIPEDAADAPKTLNLTATKTRTTWVLMKGKRRRRR